ncbi:MinD/ParA family protein [Tsukamurella columbiensis]|uniref:CobQ/CobB/MinD/ParA nucleotide binding domain-containing protein n=1 Tax=Tsukamurella columbiensis TaxID=128509 RepID=A0ABX1LM18_9ACTN|nr:hypothetical protein [Tsukamurella columbiensis]NMD57998.1 hypothetical protein [Tsukamurella columbiensis]
MTITTNNFDPHEDGEDDVNTNLNGADPQNQPEADETPAWAKKWAAAPEGPSDSDHRAVEPGFDGFDQETPGADPSLGDRGDTGGFSGYFDPNHGSRPLHAVPGPPPAAQFDPQRWVGPQPQPGQQPAYSAMQSNEPPTMAYRPAPPLAPAPDNGPAHTLFSDGAGDLKQPPSSGMRRLIFNLSGGSVNPGPSKADLRRAGLVQRVNVSPGVCGYKVVVITVKGGAGKTTSVAALLTALGLHVDASGVLGIDANPATGTLADRLDQPSRYDIRHLLANKELFSHGPDGQIDARDNVSYPTFTTYTGKSSGNFEAVQGSDNLAAAHMLTAQEYDALLDVAEKIFPIIVTDCGTEMHHDVTKAALARADRVVIVTGTARGTVKKARQALKFLNNYPADLLTEKPLQDPNTGRDIAEYRHLVSRAVVLVNNTGQKGTFKPKQLHEDFAAEIEQLRKNDDRPAEMQAPNTSKVLDLPYDDHLGLDGPIVHDLLQKSTQWAMLELAATIGDDFEASAHRHYNAAQAKRHGALVGARR